MAAHRHDGLLPTPPRPLPREEPEPAEVVTRVACGAGGTTLLVTTRCQQGRGPGSRAVTWAEDPTEQLSGCMGGGQRPWGETASPSGFSSVQGCGEAVLGAWGLGVRDYPPRR